MQRAERLRSAFGKKKLPGRLLLAALMLMSGCESMSPTDRGVVGGGALGATAGGLIGAATRTNPVVGALAGGILGATAGGLIGNEVERSEQRQAMRQAAANAPPPLSLTDIASLTQHGTSDGIIINQIRTTGSVYRLTAAQIEWLQQSGVHEGVISEMQQTAYRAPRPVYGPPPVQPVYVVEPVYAPPPVVGVGFGWGRGWR
jgi:hypothetical protein